MGGGGLYEDRDKQQREDATLLDRGVPSGTVRTNSWVSKTAGPRLSYAKKEWGRTKKNHRDGGGRKGDVKRKNGEGTSSWGGRRRKRRGEGNAGS